MSNISQWSTSAASNNAAPPNGFPEGQAPSTVNDCARELMAAVARQYLDTKGTLVTAGTGNAYTLTTNNVHAALADQGLLVFQANRANTGAATLQVDSLTAKNLFANGAALASGDIVADAAYIVAYNPGEDRYDLLNAKSTPIPDVDTLIFSGEDRVEALASGDVAVKSSGSTDTENRRILFQHADGTSRGQLGQISSELRLQNTINGGDVSFLGNNAGGAARTLLTLDPDGGCGLRYAGDNETNLETVSHDAADNSSGANVRGADGTLRGVGYNLLPRVTVSGGNHTVAIGDQGMTLFYNEATARSIIFNNDGNIPVDAYGHIRVGPTAGVCTLDGGTGVTFTYWNGTGYATTSAAGDLTLDDGSYTWWKESDTSFWIDGPDITAV